MTTGPDHALPPPGPAGAWEPANEVEERLLVAANAGDAREVLRILAAAPLLLPGFADGDPGPPVLGPLAGGPTLAGPTVDLAATDAPRQRLLTRERDGVPYLLAFTSPRGLHRTVVADGWRVTSLVELARGTPAGWGLAVNPVTPIGVLVAPDELAALVPTASTMAGFEPANEVERLLRDALVALDGEVLLDVLVTARVLVPVQALDVDGTLTVPVFTSPERYDEFVDGRRLDVPTVTLDLVAVLRQWPGADHLLAVNPGSPIAFSVAGERAPGLLAYAVRLAERRLGDRPPPAADGPDPRGGPPDPPVPRARPPMEPEPPVVLPPGGSIADLLRGGD